MPPQPQYMAGHVASMITNLLTTGEGRWHVTEVTRMDDAGYRLGFGISGQAGLSTPYTTAVHIELYVEEEVADLMPRLMVSPAVRTNLMVYGLVPLGLAMVSAGMAALEELFAERTKALADLQADIAAELGNLDAIRRDRDLARVVDVDVDVELVEVARP